MDRELSDIDGLDTIKAKEFDGDIECCDRNSSRSSLPDHPEVDSKTRAKITDNWVNHRVDKQRKLVDLNRVIDTHAVNSSSELEKLLGTKKFLALKDHRKEQEHERTEFEFKLRNTAPIKATAARDAFRQQQLKAGRKFAKQHDIDTDNIGRLNKDLKVTSSTISDVLKSPEATPAKILMPADFDKDFPKSKRWIRKGPFETTDSEVIRRFSVGDAQLTGNHNIDRGRSLFSHNVNVSVPNASPHDGAAYGYTGTFGLWHFNFFNQGNMEIWQRALSLGLTHQTSIYDEWGFSALALFHVTWLSATLTTESGAFESSILLSNYELALEINTSTIFQNPIQVTDLRSLYFYWFQFQFENQVRLVEPVWIELTVDSLYFLITDDYEVYDDYTCGLAFSPMLVNIS
ncbi:MAG: hypothetical protein AAF353_01495 [Pseudomonadota bacterium]